jgi:DNA-binding response OmpR family regulator
MPQVLLIDDSPAQLQMRAAVLRHAGLQVFEARSAQEALAFLQGDSPGTIDVIVTDHVLPGDSGAVFVRQLRATGTRIPVIVISGLPEAEEQYAGLNVTFLHKPCPPEELIVEVERAARVS